MNFYCEKEKKTILHCLYCRKKWVGVSEYASPLFWETRKPEVFRELEAAAPLEGPFLHKTVVCKNCLSRVPGLYILPYRDPMLRRAKNLKKDMEDTYTDMLNKYVQQYLSDLSLERIQELASPRSLFEDLRYLYLRERLISEAVNSFEESNVLRDWMEKNRPKLTSLEEEKERLLQFSLYDRISETAEDGTGFYRSCQNVPQAAYDSVKEKFDDPLSLYKIPWISVGPPIPVSQEVAHCLAEKYLANMYAFLQSKGVTAEMLRYIGKLRQGR